LQFQTGLSYVIPAQTAYEIWEFHAVLDHLMVIPKRHVNRLADLTDEERIDLMRVMGRYEAQGYSVYARAPQNTRRSIGHQHTHLIKIDPKPLRMSVLMTKPYWLFKF
jgi:diadenosine tetraphosphate (Ap4A) HIT family hydrolase